MTAPAPVSRRYRRGPLKGYWVAPNRRWRARLWFDYSIAKWEEAYDRYLPCWGVLDRLFRLSCVLVGHLPMDDHCVRPEHRYCRLCNVATPRAKVRGDR